MILDKVSRIENVKVSKAGQGLNLYFELDGVPYDVTGEFFIDSKQILHHSVEDENGNEIAEVLVKVQF